MSDETELEAVLKALELEEREALAKLEADYQGKRAAIAQEFAQRRSDSIASSPLRAEPSPSVGSAARADALQTSSVKVKLQDTPAALPSTPPPEPPEPRPPVQAEALQQTSSEKEKMKLWDWEQKEKAGLEEERAARIAKLDAQREKEAEEARQRQEEWRLADEARAAAEEEARLKVEADARAAQEAAAERGRAEVELREQEMKAEQERLAQEKERVRLAAAAKAEALKPKSESEDFSYAFEEGMEKKIKAFRQRGQGGDAIIIRIDHNANELKIDESFKGLASCEAFAEKLDETEPRYLLYIHKVAYADGRVQYPIAFLVFMPDSMPAHLKVMYTRPVVTLTDTFKVAKHITLEDPEDLTDEWLEKKLGIVK